MVRRLMVGVAVVAGLVVIAALGLLAFRIALAEAVLSSQLASLGVPAARLTVASLDFHRLVITDIALGDAAELRAKSVTLTYRPGELLAGRLEHAAIDGLRLRLDLSGTGPPLGSLQPLLQGNAEDGPPGGDGAGAAALVPANVILSHGRLDAALPSGDVAAVVSGQWQPPAGTAKLAVSDVALPHVDLDASRLDVDATPDRIVVTARARGTDDAVDLDLHTTVESWQGEPTLALDLDGRLAPAAWRISPLPSVGQGTMSFSVHVGGRLQPFQGVSADTAALDWFLGADLGGWLGASLADVAWRDRAQGVSGTLKLGVTVAHGGLEAVIVDGGRIGIASLGPALLHAPGLAAIAPGLGDGAITATLPVTDDPLRLRLRPTADGAEVAVSGTADVAMADAALAIRGDGALTLDKGFAVRRVSFPRVGAGLRDVTLAGGHRLRQLHLTGTIEGPPDDLAGMADLTAELAATRITDLAVGAVKLGLAAEFRSAGGHVEMRQRGSGSASAASLALGTKARIAKPFGLRLTDGALALDAAPEGLALSHAITMRPDAVAVDLPRPDTTPLVLLAEAGTLRLEGGLQPGAPYRGRLTLARSRFAVPDQALSAEAVTASIAFPVAAERLAQFAVGRLLHTGDPAAFAALGIDGEIDQQEDTLVLKATGTGAGGRVRFSVGGRHRISDGSGTLLIRVPEMAFGKGGLQPAHLSPRLRGIRDTTGRIGAAAEFAWGPGGVKSKGALHIADISFSTDTVSVTGLDTQISFDGLLPPSTPPDQELAVRRIDPALPVQDVAARFEIESGEPSRLRLKEAKGGFAGGRLGVADVVLDPSRPHYDFSVGVEGVDLGILLSQLNVKDVSASGRLSGTMPIVVSDGMVTISGGELAADGPGVLRVKSEAAASAFRGTGEQVALMLDALEDFRYEALTATLDIGADGDAAAMVRMRGNNPAVLEGYPFAFNIGLSGKVTELLAALRQGAQMSTDLVRPRLR